MLGKSGVDMEIWSGGECFLEGVGRGKVWYDGKGERTRNIITVYRYGLCLCGGVL